MPKYRYNSTVGIKTEIAVAKWLMFRTGDRAVVDSKPEHYTIEPTPSISNLA